MAGVAALVLAAGWGGCATIERGMTDRVYVLTEPPGATVTVSYSEATCLTPCSFDVNRTDGFTVAVEKPGYEAQQAVVKTQSIASDAATSHDLTADYVGRIVDSRGGANLVHVPNPVTFKLKRSGAPSSG